MLNECQMIRPNKINYLRKTKPFSAENWTVVYSDEMYLLTYHTVKKTWYDKSSEGTNIPLNKEDRFIISYVGSDQEFMDGALLVIKLGQKTGNFHGDMNSTLYKKWVTEKKANSGIIQNLNVSFG